MNFRLLVLLFFSVSLLSQSAGASCEDSYRSAHLYLHNSNSLGHSENLYHGFMAGAYVATGISAVTMVWNPWVFVGAIGTGLAVGGTPGWIREMEAWRAGDEAYIALRLFDEAARGGGPEIRQMIDSDQSITLNEREVADAIHRGNLDEVFCACRRRPFSLQDIREWVRLKTRTGI